MTHIEVAVDTREEDIERINRFSATIAEVLIELDISENHRKYLEKVIEDGLLQYDYPSKRYPCEW